MFKKDYLMATVARTQLYQLNTGLMSEEDWSAIQETLYLLSIPGMRESLIEGMKMPLSECFEDLDW
jgi:antitoxin YefM